MTRLPRSTRCIVSTRRDPPWHLRQLRLDDRLLELRGADLAFDAHEARLLLDAVVGRDFTDHQVATLVDRTDGWAVGLQLAAISLRDEPDVEASIDTFAGTDRLVADYLLEEVIVQQDPDVQQFLLRTSVLDELTVELCDAVTGAGNARAMLDHLAKRSLFLIPLDRSGERFRYHHLFADVFATSSVSTDPIAARELHQGRRLAYRPRPRGAGDPAPHRRRGVPAGVRGGHGVRAPALRARRGRDARAVARPDRSLGPRFPGGRRDQPARRLHHRRPGGCGGGDLPAAHPPHRSDTG